MSGMLEGVDPGAARSRRVTPRPVLLSGGLADQCMGTGALACRILTRMGVHEKGEQGGAGMLRRRGPRGVFLHILFTALAALSRGRAEDWPMWRHDARRSAVSADSLPAQLRLQWTRRCPALKPAFRNTRLQFDRGYEPVVLGSRMFVGSSANDSVMAVDTASGAEQWRFYTDGPVRLAPLAWRGKVYAGSDDGHLYCLDASDGSLRWRFRAVPSNRKLLGNGRLTSVWPVRGGPVLADGTVYFAAGVWPSEGVFIYALEAETGSVVWVNDRVGSLYGRQPHGAQALGGLTPQGYLAVNGDELVVPCGAAMPARFDRASGKLNSFSLPAEGRVPGGWFLATDSPEAKEARRGKVSLDSDVNRERHEDRWRRGPGEPGVRARISVGGRTLTFDHAPGGVTGEVHSMLAADGKLFVVTLDGSIHCFGESQGAARRHEGAGSALDSPDDVWRRRTAALLEEGRVTSGYALVWGIGSSRLAEELVSQSSLHVTVVDGDVVKVDAFRRRLDAAGLYGGRITVHAGDPLRFGFPPYVASLIVSEDPAAAGLDSGPASVRELFRCLRPYGGVACLPFQGEKRARFETWARGAELANGQLGSAGGFVTLRRVGALPGATNYTGGWTSPDKLVRAPLAVLWYGDAITRFKRSPQPLVLDGVMVSQGKDWLGKPAKMGPVTRLHLPGTGMYALLSSEYVDVYSGRLLSAKEAAAAGLPVAAPEPDAGQMPSYQYRPPYVSEYAEANKGRALKSHEWPFLTEVDKGERVNPMTGLTEPRRFVKSYGCEGGNDYGHLFTMRSATAAFYDKRTESGTINIGGTRSGCTNSVIPANGVLSVPYFYEGCTCSYPLPVGLALVAMPQDYEQWTAWGPARSGPIRRVGINLGAPGDRVTEAGTLWLDYPSVGGPSPEIAVTTEPKTPEFYYRHAVWAEGGRGWPWVVASGRRDLRELTVEGLRDAEFTVRLYFADPDETAPGKRVFTVMLQGQPVLEDLDIVREAGGRMRGMVREVTGVRCKGVLNVGLRPRVGVPLLSGVELVLEGLDLDPLPVLGPASAASW